MDAILCGPCKKNNSNQNSKPTVGPTYDGSGKVEFYTDNVKNVIS